MTTKILLSPLDWGLGHATRCIPIIKALIELPNVELQLAASGVGHQLYKQLFPKQILHEIVGYDVKYGHSGAGFMFALLQQIPRILSVVKAEHYWLKKLQLKEKFDVIISDNRYGMYITGIKNLFFTHQINILSGKGAFVDKILARLHRRFLKPFTEIWIVDSEGTQAVAPKLSKASVNYPNLHYLGLLSQFEKLPNRAQSNNILVLLSGPEPMRTQLQELLLKQLLTLTQYRIDFVMGTPLPALCFPPAPHISLHGLLCTSELTELLTKANLVICRSGYSSIMDLIAVGRQALFIPTPGQTEQEYLGGELSSRKWAYCITQNRVNLKADILKAQSLKALTNDLEIPVNSLSRLLNKL